MKNQLFMLIVLICCVPAVQAAAILETDFDGATANENDPNLSGVTWLAKPTISVDTTVTSLEGHELRNDLNLWIDNVVVDYNLNTDRPTPRGIVISFSTSAAFDLTELVVGHTHTNNTGGGQTYSSDMTVTLTDVTGSSDLYTDTTNYSYGYAWLSSTYDLTGVSLEAGKDYTLTLTMQDMVGGGAYAAWNQIILSDTCVQPTFDFGGPAGEGFTFSDCVVDFYDFAIFARAWLDDGF